jgi:hypothetical protein
MTAPTHPSNQARRAIAVAALLPLLLVGAACGRAATGSSTPTSSNPGSPTPASTAVTVAVSPPQSSTSARTGTSGSAASDLAQVQSDVQTIDGATNQSDADFAAGQNAQSQNDTP